MAEVAGDDRYGGISWMVRIQIHGRVFTAGKEDPVRLIYNQSKSSIVDAILGQETGRKVANSVPWNSLFVMVRSAPLALNFQLSISSHQTYYKIASRSVLTADSLNARADHHTNPLS